jgi:protease I
MTDPSDSTSDWAANTGPARNGTDEIETRDMTDKGSTSAPGNPATRNDGETAAAGATLPAMEKDLSGRTIAILVANGFEQVEMTEPRKALDDAGARTVLISPEKGRVQGMNHDEKGDKFEVERTLDTAAEKDFDALLLPGGVANPDKLRTIPAAVKFVSAFVKAQKPIAAICHGPWMLVESGAAKGLTITSWPSLKTDVTNAGGKWVDREVVVDRNVVTSRKPDYIPAFNKKMLALFGSAAA